MNWMQKKLGASWKTSLTGYIIAAAAVIQPMVSGEFDLDLKFLFRVIFATLVAIMGRHAADNSQVKKIDEKVDALKESSNT